MVVAFSLLAAFLYAVASVAQQRAASAAPREKSLRVGLLVHLVGRPLWLLGVAADIAAFGCEFVALHRGSIVVVQPLLVCGLLFALPFGAALTHTRLSRREWRGTVAILAGLALFLVVGAPAAGAPDASGAGWVVVLVATLVPAAACIAAARRRASRPADAATTAALLAAAAGIVYGLSAALTKASGHLLDEGLGHALSAWTPYALVLAGVGGMIVAQSAFQAGPLAASLPMLTIVNLVAGVAVGAVAFHEGLRASAPAVSAEAVGLAAVVVGVVTLARSPLVAVVHDPPALTGASP